MERSFRTVGRREIRPLRQQVREWVLELIQARGLRSGDRIPSEEQLARMLDVSRATLREGLQLLEQEGVIRSRHGSGRYLVAAPQALALDISRLRSVHQLLAEHGLEHRVRVLQAAVVIPPPEASAALNLSDVDQVISVERVHDVKATPIIYSVDIFPARMATSPWSPDAFAGSLLDVLENRWGIRIASARSTLRAVTLGRNLARRVGVPPSVPWILFEQVNLDAAGIPVIYSRDYHHGEFIRFQLMRFRR